LKQDVSCFIHEVDNFYEDYRTEGPKCDGIRPEDAMARLKEFDDRFEMNKRKFEINKQGEELFGLPN